MQTGAITGYIDVAQLTLYAFWLFFFGLIMYLRMEDKREGYPLDPDGGRALGTFPPIPKPKRFILPHGGECFAPRLVEAEQPPLPPMPVPGMPFYPVGDPMQQGVGAASYVLRDEHPDKMFETGLARIVPLRVAEGYYLAAEDMHPKGMLVVDLEGEPIGTVSEVWIDRSETLVRYLQVTCALNGREVLTPMNLVGLDRKRRIVKVRSVLARQFAEAPVPASLDQISLREEDRIMAYFASGHLFATASRMGPLL